jgi:hypothetical protein
VIPPHGRKTTQVITQDLLCQLATCEFLFARRRNEVSKLKVIQQCVAIAGVNPGPYPQRDLARILQELLIRRMLTVVTTNQVIETEELV